VAQEVPELLVARREFLAQMRVRWPCCTDQLKDGDGPAEIRCGFRGTAELWQHVRKSAVTPRHVSLRLDVSGLACGEQLTGVERLPIARNRTFGIA